MICKTDVMPADHKDINKFYTSLSTEIVDKFTLSSWPYEIYDFIWLATYMLPEKAGTTATLGPAGHVHLLYESFPGQFVDRLKIYQSVWPENLFLWAWSKVRP